MGKFKSLYLPTIGHMMAVIALMGLMVIPFLMNRRVGPQTGFIIESTSAVLALVMVMGVVLMGRLRQGPPVISVMLLGLAVWIVLQGRFLNLTWLSQVDLAASVLLVAALVAWALHAWQKNTAGNVFQFVAWGLFIGVLLQTGVMWLQYFGMTKHFHGYVSYSTTTNIMGQLGQRNHLGHYLMWGMVAVLYLRQAKLLGAGLAALFVVWFGLSMGLIGSRTLITYLLAIALLACVWRIRVGRSWQCHWVWVMVSLAWVLVVQFGLEKVLSLFSQAATQTGVERLANAAHVVDTGRSTEWLKAWQSFLNAPLLGHGWGGGASQSLWLHSETMVNRSPLGVLFTHSHNSVLQLLSEVGLVGVLWLVGGFVLLMWRCVKYAKRPESFAILALAAVSVCHSILEYPLWYVYFLLPFVLFWALVPTQSESVRVSHDGFMRFSRLNVVMGMLTVVVLLGMVRLVVAYQDVMSVYGVSKNETVQMAQDKKAKIHALLEREYLLNYYVRMALIERSFNPYQGEWNAEEAENARLVATYRPYASYAINWGLYQYRSGEKEAAKAWLEQVWLYYPNQINGVMKRMQTSPYYQDLLPSMRERCLQYQQKIHTLKCDA